jgi:TP901 family phage tail tape measure protein
MAGLLGTISGQVRLDVSKAIASYAALRAANARTVYAMRGTGDAMVATGKVMTVAGAAMVYAFAKVVLAAAEFERKMDFFAAVTDTNAAKMQKLSDFTLQLAQDTIYSADQIAEGMIELGKAGVSAEQIMNGIGEAMANLGAAGDIPLAESGQIITSTIQQYDLAAQDAVRVTDLLAGAANASIADIADIGVSLKYVGGVANAAGLTFEDTATAISLLAKAGIRGSTAGTSLRQMIVSLGGATGPARDALKELGIITEDGSNKFFTAEGNAKSLSQVFQILQDHTEDLTAKERLMALRTIFNNRALSAASILTRDGAKGFREMAREMSKTTAADVAAKRLDNLSGDIEILRGNLETLMIQAGGPFQETMRSWVQQLTKLVQWFSKLDPETQESIVQFFALTGAALLVMGTLNILLGTLFRFVAHLSKLGAGLKLVWRLVRVFGSILALVFGGISLAALGVIALVIAQILYLGAIFFIAYKKIAPFRWLINTIVDGLQQFGKALGRGVKAIVQWFRLLAKDPDKAWAQLKRGIAEVYRIFLDFLQQLPGLVGKGLKFILGVVGRFIGSMVQWFLSLPGRILGVITGFVSDITDLLTFRNLGYAIGFAMGLIIRLFLAMGARVVSFVASLVVRIISFFRQLPGRVGYIIGFMAGFVIRQFIKLGARVFALVRTMIARVISFFRQLPGKVAGFVISMVTRAISAMVRLAREAPAKAADATSRIIEFFRELPGDVARFFSEMVVKSIGFLRRLPAKARGLAYEVVTAITTQIQGLPGIVGGILGRVIDAFLGVIRSGYEAAKDLAAGLWEGFKDGLGISSPSFIERAMFSMNKTMGEEMNKMAKKTKQIQKLGKDMANSNFAVRDSFSASGTAEYARLAMMQRDNRNRAKTLMTASSTRPRKGDRRAARGAGGRDRTEFVITNWNTGEGYFRRIAQGTFDDESYYDDTLGRM